MIDVQEFMDSHGRSPFQPRVEDHDARAAANVAIALTHTEQRDVSNVKGMAAVRWNFRPAMARATASEPL
jgi:hypothetical protein